MKLHTIYNIPHSTFRWLTRTRRRKILSFLLAFLVLLTSVRFLFFSPKPVAASDVFLTFDEGYGTTDAVNDVNGTVAAGSITNAAWRNEDMCKVGKCLYFDGSGDYVSFADSDSLDMAASDNVTINLWFRTGDITSGTRTLISKYETAGGDGGYRIYMNSSGQIVFGIDNNNSGFPLYFVTSANAYDDNHWHFLSAVKNGTTSMSIYINSLHQGTTTITSTNAANDDTFYIGVDNSLANGWMGFIDEVKIMRSARTQDEINTDYAGQTSARGTAASFGPDQSYLSNGLVGYWKMDETNWTVNCSTDSVMDFSGNGLHGDACPNSTGPAGGAAGKFGNGGDFDGNNDYVNFGNPSQLALELPFTLAVWINLDILPSVKGADMEVFSKYYSSAGRRDYTWYFGAGDDLAFFKTSAEGAGEWAYQGINQFYSDDIGKWVHAAFTIDKDGKYQHFKNGQVVGAGKLVDNTFLHSISEVNIGRRSNNANFLDAQLDEMRVYNRALSPAEVQQLYTWAPGPVVHYKFDEGTGTNAYDSSGNGYTGTMNGSMTNGNWVPGKFGSALKFNGIDDHIDRNSQVVSNYPFTLSAWFKVEYTGENNYTIVSLSDRDVSGANLVFYSLWVRYVNGKAALSARNTSSETDDLYSDTPVVNDNQWHFISGVFESSTSRKIYIDGVLYESSTNTVNYSTNVDTLSVGSRISDIGLEAKLNGLVDDVRIYNYARTPEQIIQDMNAGHPAPGSPVGSAYIHYDFDEGYGTTAHNTGNGGSSLDATITSGTWTNSGKFGKALTFTSSTSVTDTISDPGSTNTISLWVFPTTSAASKTLATSGKLTTDSSSRPVYGGCTGNPFSTDTWTHIVSVSNGSGSCAIYQNGVQTATGTTGVTFGTTLNIGGTSFTGTIDEFKLYNLAMTAEQVKTEYNQGAATVFGSLSTDSSGTAAAFDAARAYCVPGDTSPCDPPVGEWKFDEGTGTNAYDSSGNDNTGILNGPVWQTGKFGKALKYDGIDDYINAGDNTLLRMDQNKSMTFSAWVNLPTFTGTNNVIRYDDNDNHDGDSPSTRNLYLFAVRSDGKVRFQYGPSSGLSVIDAATALTAGQWNYITAVRDTVTDTEKIYINGVLDKSETDTTTGTWETTGQYVMFGGFENLSGEYFNGLMDNVKIYNYAQTPAQIAWDMNRGEPVVQYDFDECQGTILNDVAKKADRNSTKHSATIYPGSNGNTSVGICEGSANQMWYHGVAGKYSSSLDFDGEDDYAATSNVALLAGNSSTYTNASWGGWFKPSTIPTSDTLIHKGNEFRLTTNATGYPQCEIYYSSSWNVVAASSSALGTTGWSHLLCTYDGVNGKLYVNGKLTDYKARTNSITSTSSTPLSIARDSAGSGYFDGQIDDVRVFNYALTQKQADLLYNKNSAVQFGE